MHFKGCSCSAGSKLIMQSEFYKCSSTAAITSENHYIFYTAIQIVALSELSLLNLANIRIIHIN